ncbi:MAG: copper chaperone PCu(A)C [Acetobacteraceae bacterium]
MRRPIAPPRSAAACVLRWCSGHRGLLAALAIASVVLLPRTSLAASPVTATNPWFRYIMPEVPAGGYMTLNNASAQPLALTGARSTACGMLTLHRTETGGGVDRMVPVAKVMVPAHGTFRFAPGGYHIMCMRPAMRVGESVLVTLMFADGSRIHVPFPVDGVSGPPNAAPTGAKMKMPM